MAAAIPTPDAIGEQISGIELGAITGEDWRAVTEALSVFGLLVFRDQYLSRDSQISLASRFGRIDEFDTRVPNASQTPFIAREPGVQVVTEISNIDKAGAHLASVSYSQTSLLGRQEPWRSDGSFKEIPVKASILAAVEMTPSSGGDTQFADMQAAFDGLSEAEQRDLEKLSAWHSAVYVKAAAGLIPLDAAADPTSMTGAQHDLVMPVPEQGKKALYIGQNACCIMGMGVAEGQDLIEQLRSKACRPPYVYTHQWREGDVVIWDSRRFLHRTLAWDLRHRRRLRHISIAGDA